MPSPIADRETTGGHRRLTTSIAGWWVAASVIAIGLAWLAGAWSERATAGVESRHWSDHVRHLWIQARAVTPEAARDRAALTETFRQLVSHPVRVRWTDGTASGRTDDATLIGELETERMAGGTTADDLERSYRLLSINGLDGEFVDVAMDTTELTAAAAHIRLLGAVGLGFASIIALAGIIVISRRLQPLGTFIDTLRARLDDESYDAPLPDDIRRTLPELHDDVVRLLRMAHETATTARTLRETCDRERAAHHEALEAAQMALEVETTAREAIAQQEAEVVDALHRRTRQLEVARHEAVTATEAARDAERTLHDAELRFERTVRGANDGLFDWDLDHGDVYYSPRFGQIIGRDPDTMARTTEPWFEAIASSDLSTLQNAISDHLAGHTESVQCAFRLHSGTHAERWAQCHAVAVRDPDGTPRRLAGSLADITVMKQAESSLRRAAEHDPLTGLANRRLLTERLTEACARAADDGAFRFAVLFLDFDRFKIINDTIGHHAGDDVLVSIAARLRELTPDGSTLGRLGGDEFVVIVPDLADDRDAVVCAERLVNAFALPHRIDGIEVTSTASIGVVVPDPRDLTPTDVLRNADIAMHRAKADGKARAVLFHPRMRDATIDRVRLEQDLHGAVERGELTVHYQPIVDLASGAPTGIEAFVRWTHPTRGLIGPDRFMRIAEETGLIVPIGTWVIEKACRQFGTWQRQSPHRRLQLHLNLAPAQVLHTDLIATLRAQLEAAALAPNALCLEIDESTLMQRGVTARPALHALGQLGVTLALDGFGTGEATLRCLDQLPITQLKLDRAFIRDLGQRRSMTAVTRSVIQLAHEIDIRVVAEGIETAQQLDVLQALECDAGQGFLFSRPVPAEDVAAFLAGPTPIDRPAAA